MMHKTVPKMYYKSLCSNHQGQKNYPTLKNRNQFHYQYSVNDQQLNLNLDCMNIIGASALSS